MEKEDKRQLRNNIIKFVIGIILLTMSYIYIEKHPAEKISIFSGFEVMFQKVEVFFQKILGDNGEILKKKYKLVESYAELVKMAENNKCVDPLVIQEVNEDYKTLKEESIKTLEESLPKYITKGYEYKNELTKECE